MVRAAVRVPGLRSWLGPHVRLCRGDGRALGIHDNVEPAARLEGYGYDPARAPLLPTTLAGALDALEADHELTEVLGGYFAASFVAYKRNEIERFERYVTDWEYREYAYHL
jgi:glutamine synthetase